MDLPLSPILVRAPINVRTRFSPLSSLRYRTSLWHLTNVPKVIRNLNPVQGVFTSLHVILPLLILKAALRLEFGFRRTGWGVKRWPASSTDRASERIDASLRVIDKLKVCPCRPVL